MPVPKWSLQSLLLATTVLTLATMLWVSRSELNRKSIELADLKIATGHGVEDECVQIVIKTSWMEAPQELHLENTSRGNFTISSSASGTEGDELAMSFSVHYVGRVDLKNAFAPDSTNDNGQMIAVKVSYFHPISKETKRSKTAYAVYSGYEKVAYQEGEVSVTIKPISE